jgi:site-specific DNA-methyltransferase (adenine-specific)
MTPRNVCLVGDVRTVLTTLPADSVDCIITSPPYFLLRNYGMPGQLGMEPNVDAWVEQLVGVMRELARVMKASGSLWLNVGDSYSRHDDYGAPRKGLLLGPERLVVALAADGWTVRNKVVWAKTNPKPASVRDRLSCTWESLYFLTRSTKYYYFDLDAVRVPHQSTGRRPSTTRKAAGAAVPAWAGPLAGTQAGLQQVRAQGRPGHPLGKNPGDVWRLPASGYRGAHFATFPERLVELPLLASCPEAVCSRCGRPWRRGPIKTLGKLAVRGDVAPDCGCEVDPRPGLVLDPFFGAGTVGVVANRLGRDWLGIELNPDFVALANARLSGGSGEEQAA